MSFASTSRFLPSLIFRFMHYPAQRVQSVQSLLRHMSATFVVLRLPVRSSPPLWFFSCPFHYSASHFPQLPAHMLNLKAWLNAASLRQERLFDLLVLITMDIPLWGREHPAQIMPQLILISSSWELSILPFPRSPDRVLLCSARGHREYHH